MKKILLFLPLLSLIISCTGSAGSSAAPSDANARVGNEGANGGTFAAQEVARLSGELIQIIKSSPAMFPDVSVEMLEKAVSQTRLYMVETIRVGDQELDAQNNGQDTIWVNQSRWILQNDHIIKIALLFHEYLGIMKLESNTYQISSRLLNPLFDLSDFKTFHCPENAYNFSGYYIRMRFDRITDRFLIQYVRIDEKSLANACSGYPGSVEECVKAWNPSERLGRERFQYGTGGFPNLENIVERHGTKIRFENAIPPSAGRFYWSDLLFHSDGSATFISATGSTRACSPVVP